MTNQNEEWPNAGSRVERLTLFSDAIFAFAMTLLAVNIRVPEIAQDLVGSQLNVELANLAPKFIGYALSFLISASYWVFYHRIFANIRRYDLALVWLNIVFLFFVVLIPFPSDLIGRFVQQQVAVVIYSTMMAATGFALSLIWLYASRHHRLIDESLSQAAIKAFECAHSHCALCFCCFNSSVFCSGRIHSCAMDIIGGLGACARSLSLRLITQMPAPFSSHEEDY